MTSFAENRFDFTPEAAAEDIRPRQRQKPGAGTLRTWHKKQTSGSQITCRRFHELFSISPGPPARGPGGNTFDLKIDVGSESDEWVSLGRYDVFDCIKIIQYDKQELLSLFFF